VALEAVGLLTEHVIEREGQGYGVERRLDHGVADSYPTVVAIHAGTVIGEEAPRFIIADVDPDLGEDGLCFGDDLFGQVPVELLELRPH
jgi:hypothetical protein